MKGISLKLNTRKIILNANSMSKQILTFLFIILLITHGCSESDTSKTTQIKVNGHCSMCKKSIEGPLTTERGVLSRNWSVETKILSITYDTTKISLTEIREHITASGYQSEK